MILNHFQKPTSTRPVMLSLFAGVLDKDLLGVSLPANSIVMSRCPKSQDVEAQQSGFSAARRKVGLGFMIRLDGVSQDSV